MEAQGGTTPDKAPSTGGMGHAEISVTVRAPNGASESITVKAHDRVDKVTREAVRIFIERRQIEDGEYDLALIRAGQATILQPDKRLDEYAIVQGDVFHLIVKKPQVDG